MGEALERASVDQFLQHLDSHIEDLVRLRMSLLPAEVSDPALRYAAAFFFFASYFMPNVLLTPGVCCFHSSFRHESTIRLLLGIDVLQERLAEKILQKIVFFSNTDDDGLGLSLL